jgi:phage-related protein
MICGKMANEVRQNFENALNKIVNTTDQSRNMRKEINKTIFETVSSKGNLFNKTKGMLDEKTRQNKQMEEEVNSVKTDLDACRSWTKMGQPETSSVRGVNY